MKKPNKKKKPPADHEIKLPGRKPGGGKPGSKESKSQDQIVKGGDVPNDHPT